LETNSPSKSKKDGDGKNSMSQAELSQFIKGVVGN